MRKICVIDGHTAFTGGVNLADEYINEIERFGHWKDGGICLRGAAVWNLSVMFLSTWNVDELEVENFEQYRPNVYLPAPVPTDGLVQPFMDSPLDDEEVSLSLIHIWAQGRAIGGHQADEKDLQQVDGQAQGT